MLRFNFAFCHAINRILLSIDNIVCLRNHILFTKQNIQAYTHPVYMYKLSSPIEFSQSLNEIEIEKYWFFPENHELKNTHKKAYPIYVWLANCIAVSNSNVTQFLLHLLLTIIVRKQMIGPYVYVIFSWVIERMNGVSV